VDWTASPDRQALVLFRNELKLQIIWIGVDLSSNPLHSSPKGLLRRPGAERVSCRCQRLVGGGVDRLGLVRF